MAKKVRAKAKKVVAKKVVAKKVSAKKKEIRKAAVKKVVERVVKTPPPLARGSFRSGRAQVRWEWDGKKVEASSKRVLPTVNMVVVCEGASRLSISHPNGGQYGVAPQSDGNFRFRLPGMRAGETLEIFPDASTGTVKVGG